jgi:hypothetical protein
MCVSHLIHIWSQSAHHEHEVLAPLTHRRAHASGELVKGELTSAVGVEVTEDCLQMLLTELHSTLDQALLELQRRAAL